MESSFFWYGWIWILLQQYVYLVFSQCIYQSGMYQLSLNVLWGQTLQFETYSYNTRQFYEWSPCTNNIICGSDSYKAMATQMSGGCTAIAFWDPAVGATYDPSTQTWNLLYQNGDNYQCGGGNYLSLTLSCLTNDGSTNYTNKITKVNDDGCGYEFYASGPDLCATPKPDCETSTVIVCPEGANMAVDCTSSTVSICSNSDDGDDNNNDNASKYKNIAIAVGFVIAVIFVLLCIYIIIGYFFNKICIYPHFPWNDCRHQMVHITCCCRCCYPHLFPPSSRTEDEPQQHRLLVNTQD